MQRFQDLHWAKNIWCFDIPPSNSMFMWRLMHENIPTDENLMQRGCYIPSRCSLCLMNSETSFHLFFQCPFVVRIWPWFTISIDKVLQFQSMDDIWKICDQSWSPQCKIVIKAALINLLNIIWYALNQARFNHNCITWISAINMFISSSSLSGNLTVRASNNSIKDFTILKHYKVTIHPPKTPQIKEVVWHPPRQLWLKCNTDGASKGNPGISGCGGILRNATADAMLCFVEPLGIKSSYLDELCGLADESYGNC